MNRSHRYTSYRMFLGAVAWVFLSAGCSSIAYQMRLSEGELQEKVSNVFPLEADVAIATFALVHPHVHLERGSKRIYLNVDANATGPLNSGTMKLASIHISGELDYRPDTYELVLVRPQVDDVAFVLVGSPSAQRPVFEVVNILLRTLDGLPIYNIKKNESSLAAMAIQDIEVHGEDLVVTFGH